MDFGFGPLGIGATCDPVVLTKVAKCAEESGFAELWAGDHPVFVQQHDSRYPYTADGVPPFSTAIDILDPFLTLTHIAAQTTHVRIGTNVYLPALRHPLLTAKQVASLDRLSGGRIDLGIGVGWLAEEFAALGVPWSQRGRRTDELIRVMKSAWSGNAEGFNGDFYSYEPLQCRPIPVQIPHPPILIGGDSDTAFKRVARLGDGWSGFHNSPEESAAKIKRIHELTLDAGRNPGQLKFAVGPPPEVALTLDEAKRYRDAGVDHLIMTVVSDDPAQILSLITDTADKIISRM